MWDDTDVSATVTHDSLTISASNPTTITAVSISTEHERKSSAPPEAVQSRKSFLEGLKMRGSSSPRTRGDDIVCTTPGSALTTATTATTTPDLEGNACQLRSTSASIDGAATTADTIVAGSVAQVVVDYRPVDGDEVAVDRGETVQVREVVPHRRYVVLTQSGRVGLVPFYVLGLPTISLSKKPPTTGCLTMKNRFNRHGTLKEDNFVDATCTVNCGDTAALRCARIKSSLSGGSGVRWMAPNGHMLINSGRKYSFGADADTVVLYILDCDVRDSGEYSCVQYDNVESIITLRVKDIASEGLASQPEPPRVVDLRETTAVLALEHATDASFTVECCRITDPNKSWTVVNKNPAGGICIVEDLTPGETYSFRVSVDGCSETSLPSNPLTVPPLSEVIAVAVNNPLHKRNSFQDLDDCWQRDFERQFIELEELGRGRYAVVRRFVNAF